MKCFIGETSPKGITQFLVCVANCLMPKFSATFTNFLRFAKVPRWRVILQIETM